jgi:hypothetical protein
MTAQISDIVFHRGLEYALASYSVEPFSPADFGYSPAIASTACVRGYLAEYEVRNGSLLLRRLSINHYVLGSDESLAERPCDLFGVQAEEWDNSYIGRWVFRNLNMPLQYSGVLILAREFIRSLYVHMGFHPAWKYEEALELVFESGRLASERDLGPEMADIRKRMQ